jgi:hypothetical protein
MLPLRSAHLHSIQRCRGACYNSGRLQGLSCLGPTVLDPWPDTWLLLSTLYQLEASNDTSCKLS